MRERPIVINQETQLDEHGDKIAQVIEDRIQTFAEALESQEIDFDSAKVDYQGDLNDIERQARRDIYADSQADLKRQLAEAGRAQALAESRRRG